MFCLSTGNDIRCSPETSASMRCSISITLYVLLTSIVASANWLRVSGSCGSVACSSAFMFRSRRSMIPTRPYRASMRSMKRFWALETCSACDVSPRSCNGSLELELLTNVWAFISWSERSLSRFRISLFSLITNGSETLLSPPSWSSWITLGVAAVSCRVDVVASSTSSSNGSTGSRADTLLWTLLRDSDRDPLASSSGVVESRQGDNMAASLAGTSLFYEILSGVWVRNGLQIKGQAMTYIQANFCNSMVDMDLFFLQICATQLPPNHFLGECIAIFGVEDWLGLSLISASPEMEQDSMLEGLLTFLATLITSRINLGNDETTQCIIEISALLATGDKTHSQLLELMPERSGNAHTRNFERYLRELSIYRSPPVGSENLEQGMFMPVPAVWERHYDPLHVLLRAVHRRDFQNSLDRFGAYVKQAGKMPLSGNLWPPFRMPGSCGPAYSDPGAVLGSRILHATILVIFYRAVHTHSVSEHMLALAVFLLEMAVSAAGAAGGEAATSRSTVGDSGAAGGSTSAVDSSAHAGAEASGGSNAREPAVPDLLDCYPSNCLSDNLRMQVKRISLLPMTRRSPVSYHKPLDGGSSPPFDSDVEWDLSEDETLMMIGSSADTLEGDPGGVARAAGAISGEGNRVAGVRMTELVPSSRAGIEVVPLSQDLAMLAHRVAIHAPPPLPSSTASQMVVEEEEDEDHGDDDEDDEEGEPDGDEGGDDAYGNRALEDELRRRRLWRLRYRSRQQEAPVQESQDEDMLYHVMDEDDDVMVEDGSLRNNPQQQQQQQQQVVLARAAPRAHEHQQTHHHPPVQMMLLEDSRRRRFSGGNANVVLPADVEDYLIDDEDEDDDDDEEEGDDGEVEEEEDEYVDVEGLPGEERGQGDGDDGEAIMNAVIQSIVPRASEGPPRRGLAGAHQQLIGQVGHATTTRQPEGDEDEEEEEEEEEIVRELVDGGAPRVQRNRQRRQEIAIPARAPTPPVIASRASVGGLLLPLTRVQPMGADEPRPPSGGGGAQAEGGLNVVAHQQTQLQNYYAVATHHHHHHHHQHQHHHHHRHRHHHNHHAEGTGGAAGQPPGQQQLNPQSLQQQTPRHYRSLQGGPGQHGAGSTGPGGHQAPLWMRFRRRRNLAVSRQRNTQCNHYRITAEMDFGTVKTLNAALEGSGGGFARILLCDS
uniref:E3 ubiquitin-protein ligase n=1 Tax=Anopheles atroparvus TaxID=41427 RepID=A0A182JDL2_ANOAO